MRKIKFYQAWMLAALLAIFMSAGCACEDDSCSGDDGGGAVVLNRPTVTFVAPYNTEIAVPINHQVAATFSQDMDPVTINNATATLTGPGVDPINGVVTYDPVTHIATINPDSDLVANTTYMATITLGAENLKGVSMADPFVWTFTTGVTPDILPPTVILTSPANLSTGVAFNKVIVAAFSEVMDPATITPPGTFTVKSGLVPIAGTVTYVGQIATFTPSAPLLANTTYTAEITNAASDLAGNALIGGLAPNPWTFTTGATPDTARPTIVATIPLNLATGVPYNNTVKATFSEAMLASSLTTASFKLTGPGGTAVTGTVSYNPLTDTATFSPLIPLSPLTTYTATVTSAAADLAGNALIAGSTPNPWTFTTGATANTSRPSVTFVTPYNTEIGVPINRKVTATFSEPMNPATIGIGTFTLTGPGPVFVTGSVSYDPITQIATFDPDSDLASNTTYLATITLGAENPEGISMFTPFVWVFTTGVTPDTLPPTVILTSPSNLLTGVPFNKVIVAAFSEVMDPATITPPGTFTVKVGLLPIAGTVTYVGQIATFTPSAPLLANTTYTAEITNAASDLAGNALIGGLAPNPWTFTTGATPDTVRPTIVATIPLNLATGVPYNNTVKATFSEAMRATSLTTASFKLTGPGGTPVTGTVSYNPLTDTATFSPIIPLSPLTTYTATVTSAAADLAGNPLIAGLTPNPWTFTTGATANTSRPRVTFVTPYNTETGVPINRKVTATFSEPMNPATIGIGTFTLTGPGPVFVTGSVSYDPITRIATFDPDSNLASNTTYLATITLGAENPEGNSLLIPFVWVFTTGVTPDTTRPTLVMTNPAHLSTGKPTNTAVLAAFSEPMDHTTIILPGTFTLKQGLTPVAGTVTYIGLVATFTPSAPLLPFTTYTAEVTNAAKDLAGNILIGGLVPNPWTFTTGAAPDTNAPTIIAVFPANGATGVPINTTFSALFSEAMDPTTMTTENTMISPWGPGTVSYDPLTHLATGTQNELLMPNTLYTVTVTTGVTDLAGNHMLNDYVWTFRTAAVINPLSPIDLGAVANFAIIGGGGISSVPTSSIFGDIGVSPASGAAITGFSSPLTCPEVNGTVYAVDATGPACAFIDAAGLAAAKLALTVAYNEAAGRTIPAPATVSGDQGGLTLAPGIYKSTSTLLIASGDLTLDAQGDANAVWIFQIASTLTTVGCGSVVPCTTGGNVKLINGANAANIFWQVGTAATIGDFTDFYGTILAHDDISINTGAHVHGRLLSGAQPSGAGAVTLISATVIKP